MTDWNFVSVSLTADATTDLLSFLAWGDNGNTINLPADGVPDGGQFTIRAQHTGARKSSALRDCPPGRWRQAFGVAARGHSLIITLAGLSALLGRPSPAICPLIAEPTRYNILPAFLDQQHLLSFLLNVVRLCAWLLLLALIFLPLERLFAVHPQKFFRKALAQDLGYYFISGLVPGLLLAFPLSLVALGAHAMVPYRLQAAVAAWPLWQRILAGLVVGEIGFYWGHRWTHEIPFLWRFHSVHHSAEHVYFLISSRAHPLDNVFIRLCGLIPAYILGVASPLTPTGSLVPVLIVLVATIWGFFIHSNLRWRLGPLEWLIATPAFHHWHHTLREPLDRNYASMLPWMDWIFGTFYLPKQWPSAYGTDAKLPGSLGRQLVYPLLPEPAQGNVAEPIAAGAYEREPSILHE